MISGDIRCCMLYLLFFYRLIDLCIISSHDMFTSCLSIRTFYLMFFLGYSCIGWSIVWSSLSFHNYAVHELISDFFQSGLPENGWTMDHRGREPPYHPKHLCWLSTQHLTVCCFLLFQNQNFEQGVWSLDTVAFWISWDPP